MKADSRKVPASRMRQAQRHQHRQGSRQRGIGSALQARGVLLRGLAALGTGRLGRGGSVEYGRSPFAQFAPMRQRMPQRALLTKQQEHGQQASQPTQMEEGGAEGTQGRALGAGAQYHPTLRAPMQLSCEF